MMLEMLMFAVIFCVVQGLVGFALASLFMSDWFMKKITKKSINMSKSIVEDLDEFWN